MFFFPIISVVVVLTYDLAKFLAPILKLLTKNEYPVHHSFSKASEVSKFIFKSLKASINVESLFTKVL